MVKNLPATWETQVRSLGWEDPQEKGMPTYSNILAWRIPWTEEPGGLQSMGSFLSLKQEKDNKDSKTLVGQDSISDCLSWNTQADNRINTLDFSFPSIHCLTLTKFPLVPPTCPFFKTK